MDWSTAVLRVGLCTAALLSTLAWAGCGDEDGGLYCCTYESRSTGCGGTDWKEWQAESYEFNLDDYKEGWSAEQVCNKFSGSDTECGGSCCINVEYRNTQLAGGPCD